MSKEQEKLFSLTLNRVLDRLGARGASRGALSRVAWYHQPQEHQQDTGDLTGTITTYTCGRCKEIYPCFSLKLISPTGWNLNHDHH